MSIEGEILACSCVDVLRAVDNIALGRPLSE
jgi:hypothetical protein